MKILVPIKRVIDYNVRVQLKRDNSGVQTDGVKMSINPFDEIAVEEALRIKERGDAEEVIVVSIGAKVCEQQIRNALAMGADRGILVETDDAVQPLGAARILQKIREEEGTDLVIMGKQAIDDDCNQTGQMLAAISNLPQATFGSKVELANGKATVTREVDEGLEVIEVDLPAIITTDLRLNEPRFVKMPDIMKAKKKPLDVKPLADLGVEMPPALENTGYAPPPKREGGKKVESVEELVEAMKNKGVL
ncbi:MAG: electron transfer flavoprotein subunit beta/FixA family protein [Gammaproteobacteria bacterium]|nr:electron transfer flavoprotein subunit beta/FixA family protein [Gammaproteobacteria bacterium]